MIPAVIASCLLGGSPAISSNLITGEDPVAAPNFSGSFNGGTVVIGNFFASNPFQIDIDKFYRLSYATNSSSIGSIVLFGGSWSSQGSGALILLSGAYSESTTYTFGPGDFLGGAFFASGSAWLAIQSLVAGNDILTNLSLTELHLVANAANTILTMAPNQKALGSLLTQRSSAIMAMMEYDCDAFHVKNFCISFRARYTTMASQDEGAGVLTAAYRANANVRVGGFIDYRASERDVIGLKQGDTLPTLGAFAVYNERGDATGLQMKASVAYNTGKVAVSRNSSLVNTESGSGKADLDSYAIGAEMGWGIVVSPTMLAAPYAGVRYTDATRNGYTEGAGAGTVDFPITYNAYYQRLTTATAGVRLSGMFSDKVGYQASLGGEYDLSHQAGAYSGASTISGLETFALANVGASNRSRVNASAGLHYQVDKTQRLTANVSVRGQAYSSQPSVTTLVGYQMAF